MKKIPILLIDDDPAVRGAVAAFLDLWDFDVAEAEGFAMAEEYFRAEHEVKIVLTDYWVNPHGTATAFYRRIRDVLHLRHGFLAVMSGGNMCEEDARFFASEGIVILQKPFSFEKELHPLLIEAIRRVPPD